MPPGLGNKGKNKAKDGGGRYSRSRNTTPGSAVSAPISATSTHTSYLDIAVGALMVPSNVMYDEVLERHNVLSGIPDLKHLETLKHDLTTLGQLAITREKACDIGIRELSSRRKQRYEDELETEQANREAEEKANLKRPAEDDEVDKPTKPKIKRRRDQGKIREERPLAHGAHGVTKQDGSGMSPKGKGTSPMVIKTSTASGSSSSLSPPSQAQSPIATENQDHSSRRNSLARSSSSEDSHQPPPAASIPQYQTFGSNPLEFDDPTVYHVREIRQDMTDEEKKEIYCVSTFPHSDLKDLIAGTPPDKDFSNAKPTNQVNANTFASYIEPFFRQLTDEDMAFLKERGDRVTPFLMPRRGNKHYTQIWAEEEGSAPNESTPENSKLSQNHPRGNLDQMDDDAAETDQISTGPMTSRFLSTMRIEQRSEEKDKTNGIVNGEFSGNHVNGEMNGDHANEGPNDDRPPPAVTFPESANAAWRNAPLPKQDYAQADERLKSELRFIGFLGPEDEPNYDSHYDDEVAQRLRLLQTELKKQMVINGARKARLHQIAEEHMGYQEFAHIKEDLDNQVVQAFSKRNRTLGKGKKNAKRPGGAGGGSHQSGPGGNAGVSRPGIGDAARTIMDRRKRWNDTISPIFSEDVIKVRGADESIFKDEDMAPFLAAEKERMEEEGPE